MNRSTSLATADVVILPVASKPVPASPFRRRALATVAGVGAAVVASGAHAQTSGSGSSGAFDPTQIIAGFTANSQAMLTLVADVTPYALAVVGLVAGFHFLWGTLRKA